jgi:hypothetical protein
MAENGTSTYILYYNPYSICSIQVNYTLELRGEPKDAASAMNIEKRVVNIFNQEQLTENFLCEINAEGQVRRQSYTRTSSIDLFRCRFFRLLPGFHCRTVSR